MATLNTIAAKDNEVVRVLLTCTSSGIRNIQPPDATMSGDGVFSDDLELFGVWVNRGSQGYFRLRNTGGDGFSVWRATQTLPIRMWVATNRDSDTERECTENNVGGGFWNWHLPTGVTWPPVFNDGDTINIVIATSETTTPTDHDVEADVEAGAPEVTAAAEKVDIATPHHDVDADVTAGAPSVTADAERVEGGIQETGDVDVTAGSPEVDADAESVPVDTPFHDTAAEVDAGAPSVSARAEKVEPGVRAVDVGVDAGAPSVDVEAEHVQAVTHDAEADVTAGAPSVDVGAERIEVGTMDVSADIIAGAPDVDAGAVKTGLYVYRCTPLQSPFSIQQFAKGGPRESQGRMEPTGLGFNTEFWIETPETWDKGNSFILNVARHLEENIAGLKLDSTLFIHGRRVPAALGAGDVVLWQYASGPSEWVLGQRRVKYAYPRVQVTVRVGPDGEDYDRADALAWNIHNVLSRSWTGNIPRVV